MRIELGEDEFNSPGLSLAFEDYVEAEVEATEAAPCYLATVEHEVIEPDAVAEPNQEPVALTAVVIAVASVSRWTYQIAQANLKAQQLSSRAPRVSRVQKIVWAMG